MRRALCAALAVGLMAAPARSQGRAAAAPSEPATAAANLAALQPCGARAARYAGDKGFAVVVTRLGRASVENPLRPLTPEVSQVLQVAIAGKPATAYGPDLTALRRGPAPAALEAQLGAPVRWEAALPALPDPLEIVAEDGTPLARLAFRDCTDPPPAAAAAGRADGKTGAPRAAGPADGSKAPRRAATPKAPPGFRVPQGAIAE